MKITEPFTTIYEDEHIVVLNKKSGLLVAADRYDVNAERLDKLAKEKYGTILAVHRIDKDTSGLIMYARSEEAHRALSIAFEERKIKKTYHALVYGHPLWDELTVTDALLPDGDDRHRTVVNKRYGKPSETFFGNIGSCGPYSWIIAKPKTGRTHQIRAHLLSLGLSIVCDPLYGGNQKPVRLSEIKRSYKGDPFDERPLLNRLALHAYKLEFLHPITQENMIVTAPYFKDMDSVRKQLKKIYKTDPLDYEA